MSYICSKQVISICHYCIQCSSLLQMSDVYSFYSESSNTRHSTLYNSYPYLFLILNINTEQFH